MKKTKLITISLCLALLSSCTNDSEDDLIALDDNGTEGADAPSEDGITYENTVQAIMQASCVGCHADPPRNGAPFALVNFTQVSGRANGILNAMSRQNGAPGAMPPSGRLPQNTIDQIDQWIQDGTPEN